MATLTEIKKELETAVDAYNDAVVENKIETSVLKATEIERLVNTYNETSWNNTLRELRASETPIFDAMVALKYPCIKVSDKKEKGSELRIKNVVDTEKYIDILKIPTDGKTPEWELYIEKMNFVMTTWAANKLGMKLDFKKYPYAMKKLARDIDMGKTPTSNTQMLKNLQAIVTALIGEEYKVTSHDVEFIKLVCGKKGNIPQSFTSATHKAFREMIMDICNRIILNKGYTVIYKVEKQK